MPEESTGPAQLKTSAKNAAALLAKIAWLGAGWGLAGGAVEVQMVSSDFDLGGFEKPETVFVKKEWRNCKPDHNVFPYNETRVELRRR